MDQNSSWPLCRFDPQPQKTFGWGYCCQRRVNFLLNPRVYILIPTCTVNVYTICSIKTWTIIIVCVISLSRLFVYCCDLGDDTIMTNLCRNPGYSKGSHNFPNLCLRIYLIWQTWIGLHQYTFSNPVTWYQLGCRPIMLRKGRSRNIRLKVMSSVGREARCSSG